MSNRPKIMGGEAERKAKMATRLMQAVPRRAAPVPRELRARVEPLLAESYAYMDSPVFRRKTIENELFSFGQTGGHEPALPLTSWYQPTRDEVVDISVTGAPQLMKAP